MKMSSWAGLLLVAGFLMVAAVVILTISGGVPLWTIVLLLASAIGLIVAFLQEIRKVRR